MPQRPHYVLQTQKQVKLQLLAYSFNVACESKHWTSHHSVLLCQVFPVMCKRGRPELEVGELDLVRTASYLLDAHC